MAGLGVCAGLRRRKFTDLSFILWHSGRLSKRRCSDALLGKLGMTLAFRIELMLRSRIRLRIRNKRLLRYLQVDSGGRGVTQRQSSRG